ncbi:A/G-specific adenine glycosylase [Flavobacterium arcticum]|uniref:Adenine DNA glycosylase n=1 Tax=Flavobacterium arcticum TaxID=1784713 RepID=A0A345HBY9_9FLAO|nr:A/G-specific adenine glycosylase [Flavobacterium arcticum]AXG74099.1 A/G-specific adenine glycosylase [Flavobacterium arcticum]KAF2507341.1 A/G-specific adenine glycosylase [Flavobacterium arcticum]
MDFSKHLIQWYLHNKRDLPWRKNSHPYSVWLSEIMLQQTRVAQGMPYFFKFITAFPTVNDLANAPEEQVLKLWQGLGYYSRARNLHATAKYIAYELHGIFPDNYKELLKLKGVGDYTAAAIASICYGEPVPVVDGNVYRVLSRYFGIETDISSSPAKAEFRALAAKYLPRDKASEFNQAMMEFGALQCVPKSPDCAACIFSADCVAFTTGKVSVLPVKLKKTKVTNRYFNYIVVKDANGSSVVNKRSGKGIWHNLYEFPLIETETAVPEQEMSKTICGYEGLGFIPQNVSLLVDTVVHKLSHQHLHIRFWEVVTNAVVTGAMNRDKIKQYPFPIVVHNFIEKHWD